MFKLASSRKSSEMSASTVPGDEAVFGTDLAAAVRSKTVSEFLTRFVTTHRDDDFLSIKYGCYTVQGEEEAVGEIVDWTLQYLHYM